MRSEIALLLGDAERCGNCHMFRQGWCYGKSSVEKKGSFTGGRTKKLHMKGFLSSELLPQKAF